jgi:AmiR/NasT family two-component response regulator
MEEQDPEWRALVEAVHSRDVLSEAVAVLAARHSLDESTAIRRLLWVAIEREVALWDAALAVLAGADDAPG